MTEFRRCHQCHKFNLEKNMRMFNDNVWVCFKHTRQNEMQRWYDGIKAPPPPKMDPFNAEDFYIPVELRPCPAHWYAYSFDGKEKSMKPTVSNKKI